MYENTNLFIGWCVIWYIYIYMWYEPYNNYVLAYIPPAQFYWWLNPTWTIHENKPLAAQSPAGSVPASRLLQFGSLMSKRRGNGKAMINKRLNGNHDLYIIYDLYNICTVYVSYNIYSDLFEGFPQIDYLMTRGFPKKSRIHPFWWSIRLI